MEERSCATDYAWDCYRLCAEGVGRWLWRLSSSNATATDYALNLSLGETTDYAQQPEFWTALTTVYASGVRIARRLAFICAAADAHDYRLCVGNTHDFRDLTCGMAKTSDVPS